MKIKNQRGFTVLEIVIVVVLVGALCGAGGYVVSQNKQKKSNDTSQTSSQPKAEDSTSTTEQIPDLIDYGKPGIEIVQKSDVGKLTRASDNFKAYINSLVRDKPTYNDGCEYPQKLFIERIYKDEFALGGTSGCGGALLVWKKTDNKWARAENIGGHSYPECKHIISQEIPPQIVEKCFDEDNPSADENGLINNPN